MKNKLKFPVLSLLLVGILACSGESGEASGVEGKKKLLDDKKTELKTLESEISLLKEELLILDPPKEKEALLVKTVTAVNQDFTRFTDVQASVMSDDMVYASSELGGRIVTLNVREGQYVKKGSLIATVDMQAIIDQKEELETGIGLAKDIYERQSRLWDQKIGTELQFLQAKNSFERLEKSLKGFSTQLAKANIYAPMSGVVDKEFLQAGEMSSPGAPIVQMFNPNNLIIVADVPESYLGKIKRGQRVDVSFPALGENVNKPVSLVGRTIDPSNRTFKVEVNSNNMGGKLKPNLLAEISFKDFFQKDALSVNLSLVQEEVSGRKYVYIAERRRDKLIARKSYITIGETSQGDALVESGLKAGDKVITEGARSVSDGVTVKELMN
ncbi:MAG: membrane fusion protein (multidrug efflux system) [Psychromonas sp.]|jgi:membrane fusion protein (multidrug efflux system)